MSANDNAFGLVAIGTSGGWSIEIDQSSDDLGNWQLQIESRIVDLRFPIEGPHACEQLREFLTSDQSPNCDELSLGGRVTVLCDDEFADRYFLLLDFDDSTTIRVCVAGDDLACIREALDQVHGDLVSDGVLS